jgi:hypothetical protein
VRTKKTAEITIVSHDTERSAVMEHIVYCSFLIYDQVGSNSTAGHT